MKKEDNFIGLDGINRNWTLLENEYYSDITKLGGRGYKTPLERLNKLYTASTKSREKYILRFLIKSFKKIIISKPEDLEKIILMFKKHKYENLFYSIKTKRQKKFGQEIEWAFRYDDFRKNKLILLAEKLNIKACLYCNSQYTLVVNKGNLKIAKFQFDHFFPKSRFPYLSISLYNLIPSCSSCNHSKSNTPYKLSKFSHPYVEDFHKLFNFDITVLGHSKLLMCKKVTSKEIEPFLNHAKNVKVINYDKEFHLTGIYRHHLDIIKNIYLQAYAYNNGGKAALLNLKNNNGIKLFNNEQEIEKMVLANYTLEEDINKRPLTKFMQDMARNSGLIK